MIRVVAAKLNFSAFKQFDKGLGKDRVELFAGLGPQDLDRFLRRHGILVVADGGHCVESIRNAQNTAGDRNIVISQTIGIAVAVISLVTFDKSTFHPMKL